MQVNEIESLLDTHIHTKTFYLFFCVYVMNAFRWVLKMNKKERPPDRRVVCRPVRFWVNCYEIIGFFFSSNIVLFSLSLSLAKVFFISLIPPPLLWVWHLFRSCQPQPFFFTFFNSNQPAPIRQLS
jgi:hypothetical protein